MDAGITMNDIYPDSKKAQDRLVSPYIYWVLRPVSFGVSRWLANQGVTAMQCTAASALVLLAGLFLMVAGPALGLSTYMGMFLGAVLINFYVYLDVVDGNIARIAGSSSSAGEFADSTVNVFAGFSMPVAAGLGVYWYGGGFVTDVGWFTAELALGMGLVIGYCRLFRRVVYDKLNDLAGGDRFSILGNKQPSGKVSAFAYIAALVNSGVYPFLLVAAVFNAVVFWLLVYFVFNILVVCYVLVTGFNKTNRSAIS